jgi:uncharacterized protein YceK
MKKTTLAFLFLVVITTMLIAGCTTVQTLPAPTTTPAATAVPTYVQNQQGVAIIKTVNVTPSPTATVQPNLTIEVKTAQVVAVK